MASTSETGHAKNVANVQDLISFLTGFAATYNPSKNALSINSLVLWVKLSYCNNFLVASELGFCLKLSTTSFFINPKLSAAFNCATETLGAIFLPQPLP